MWALILSSELGAEVLIQHILLGHAQPVQVLDGVGDEAPGAADVELALGVGDETGQGALAIFRVHVLRRKEFNASVSTRGIWLVLTGICPQKKFPYPVSGTFLPVVIICRWEGLVIENIWCVLVSYGWFSVVGPSALVVNALLCKVFIKRVKMLLNFLNISKYRLTLSLEYIQCTVDPSAADDIAVSISCLNGWLSELEARYINVFWKQR